MMAEGLNVVPTYGIGKEDSFGGGGMILFFLFFLLAIGGNGGGLFGGNATQNAISNDFMYSNLTNQIARGTDTTLLAFNSLQNGIANIDYDALNNARETQIAVMQGNNVLQAQMASCCSGIEKEILVSRYEAEKGTAAIVQAIHADGEATRGLITQNTIQDLRDRLGASELANSQCAQNAYLVNSLRPYPVPAFSSCNPMGSAFAYPVC